MRFKFISHTADLKFQAFGKNLEEVFKNSALALSNSIYDGKVKEKKTFKIKAQGHDLENLLYEFLEEFLVLFDSKNFLLSKIKNLKLDEKKLKIEAEIVGDDVINYETSMHIKAITYNEMFVKKEKDKWISQVVVDI